MSSREIAELTGKRHDNVMRDIQAMCSELGIEALKFEGYYKALNGKQNPEYHLPYRETMIVVSGYSVQMRARIVDRWQELEAKVAAPAPIDFRDPAILIGVLSDLQQQVKEKDIAIGLRDAVIEGQGDKIAVMQPKEDAFDAFMDARNGSTRREVAKDFGIPPKALNDWLAEIGWTFGDPDKEDRHQGRSKHLEHADGSGNGYMRHYNDSRTSARTGKTSNFSVILITPKGRAKLTKLLQTDASMAQYRRGRADPQGSLALYAA